MSAFYKAISLIELLITLAVMVIAIYFISPAIFHLPDPIILNNEVEQIRSFFYQIQTKARFTKTNYSLSVSQKNNQWCIIAIEKAEENKEITCNCLNLLSCTIPASYHLYKSKESIKHKVSLKSKDLYPNSFINIDGITGKLESKCLGLRINKSQLVMQFNEYGVINVAQQDKRTECRENISRI